MCSAAGRTTTGAADGSKSASVAASNAAQE
jgi:hypothetical protein